MRSERCDEAGQRARHLRRMMSAAWRSEGVVEPVDAAELLCINTKIQKCCVATVFSFTVLDTVFSRLRRAQTSHSFSHTSI